MILVVFNSQPVQPESQGWRQCLWPSRLVHRGTAQAKSSKMSSHYHESLQKSFNLYQLYAEAKFEKTWAMPSKFWACFLVSLFSGWAKAEFALFRDGTSLTRRLLTRTNMEHIWIQPSESQQVERSRAKYYLLLRFYNSARGQCPHIQKEWSWFVVWFACLL